MSIRSSSDLAIRRDETPAGHMVRSNDDTRDIERSIDVLITAVPTEILTLYSALTAGSLALLIDQDAGAYLPYRWTLLIIAVVLTPLAVAGTYRRKSGRSKPSRVPWAEMTAATIAAAAFFLAMPGSPLLAQISGTAGLLATAAISLITPAFLLIVFGDLLRTGTREPASPATVSPAAGLADAASHD